MAPGSGFALLVAAASVSQLVQVTINIIWPSPVLPVPSVTETTTVVEIRFTRVESAPCPPAEAGFFEDPYEREALYGSNSLSFLTGGFLAAGAGALSCCRRAQPVSQQHGRGAELQNQRARGRGRLSITVSGSLGSTVV